MYQKATITLDFSFYDETYGERRDLNNMPRLENYRFKFLGDRPPYQTQPKVLPPEKLDLIIYTMNKLNSEELTRIAYNCRKATFLIEKKHFSKITIKEKFQLKVHLATCAICCIFEKQSFVINTMMQNIANTNKQNDQILDEHFKNTMQQKIEDLLGKNSHAED